MAWQLCWLVELDRLGVVSDEQRTRFWTAFSIGLAFTLTWTVLSIAANILETSFSALLGDVVPASAFSPSTFPLVWVVGLAIGMWAAAVKGRVLLEAFDRVEGDHVQSWGAQRWLVTQFLSLWMLFNYGRVRDAFLDAYDAEPAA